MYSSLIIEVLVFLPYIKCTEINSSDSEIDIRIKYGSHENLIALMNELSDNPHEKEEKSSRFVYRITRKGSNYLVIRTNTVTKKNFINKMMHYLNRKYWKFLMSFTFKKEVEEMLKVIFEEFEFLDELVLFVSLAIYNTNGFTTMSQYNVQGQERHEWCWRGIMGINGNENYTRLAEITHDDTLLTNTGSLASYSREATIASVLFWQDQIARKTAVNQGVRLDLSEIIKIFNPKFNDPNLSEEFKVCFSIVKRIFNKMWFLFIYPDD